MNPKIKGEPREKTPVTRHMGVNYEYGICYPWGKDRPIQLVKSIPMDQDEDGCQNEVNAPNSNNQ